MDYRFKHPIYTNEDSDAAVEHLIEYIENNNIPEHNATSDHEFTHKKSEIPKEIMKQVIRKQYGVNLINIANILLMQDLFFREYMPHISRYLDLIGVKYYFSYMRPSNITSRYIIRMYLSGKMINPLSYWNSDVLWDDYSYRSDNPNMNIMNPINNFYMANLVLYNISNDTFMDAFDKLYGKNTKSERGETNTICIKMLPSVNPSFMMQITKLIHKYL